MAGAGDRVLVVDDQEAIRELFSMILNRGLPDISVDQAANGREAVEQFSAHHHAVVLMDLHMPVMDGLSAFQSIAQQCGDGGARMPDVLFCTGYAPPKTVLEIVEQDPAHQLLIKPVRSETLVSLVKRHLQARPGL